MSSLGRSPWKEVNRHIRGFYSLNCLKPYWLRIMIISVLFFYASSTIAISLEELIEYLTTYIHEAALHIIGSFSVASHYIIQLKNIFYQLFFKLSYFLLYILKLLNQGNFTWGWIIWLLGFDFYIFILLNKYITFWTLVIWAIKNSKKNLKKSLN